MTHLTDAVGELVRHHTMRIHYLPGAPDRHYTVRAPSLLTQLADLIATSNNGRGGRTVPTSRLPLDPTALQLWTDLASNVHGWARELGINRRPYLTGRPVDDEAATLLGRLLRATAAAATARGDDDLIADAIGRRCWCAAADITPADCRRGCWTHRIRAVLTGTVSDRELRGVACPDCGAYTATEHRDRETYRVPAVIVRVAHLPDAGPDDLWVYRMCRACHAEGWLDYTTQTGVAAPA